MMRICTVLKNNWKNSRNRLTVSANTGCGLVAFSLGRLPPLLSGCISRQKESGQRTRGSSATRRHEKPCSARVFLHWFFTGGRRVAECLCESFLFIGRPVKCHEAITALRRRTGQQPPSNTVACEGCHLKRKVFWPVWGGEKHLCRSVECQTMMSQIFADFFPVLPQPKFIDGSWSPLRSAPWFLMGLALCVTAPLLKAYVSLVQWTLSRRTGDEKDIVVTKRDAVIMCVLFAALLGLAWLLPLFTSLSTWWVPGGHQVPAHFSDWEIPVILLLMTCVRLWVLKSPHYQLSEGSMPGGERSLSRWLRCIQFGNQATDWSKDAVGYWIAKSVKDRRSEMREWVEDQRTRYRLAILMTFSIVWCLVGSCRSVQEIRQSASAPIPSGFLWFLLLLLGIAAPLLVSLVRDITAHSKHAPPQEWARWGGRRIALRSQYATCATECGRVYHQ